VGVGVGKRWARSLMKAAAEQTGGHFTQISPDESIGWRAFELAATLRTPRLLDVQVIDRKERAIFQTHTSTIAQGAELCAAARLAPGEPLPEVVTVRGKLDGKPFARELAIRFDERNADYLPLIWAQL
jgi:hypothetical protein